MNGVIGEIRGFGGNFAPRAWAFCEGQLLSINANQALFSILGTTYGGDGRTTFALPDLRGRIPVSQGRGPGLSNHNLGARSGQEVVTITQTSMPSHNHFAVATTVAAIADLNISSAGGTSGSPIAGGSLGVEAASSAFFYNDDPAPDTQLAQASISNIQINETVTVTPTGGSQYHNNMMPYLTIYWIICMQGIYPSRG